MPRSISNILVSDHRLAELDDGTDGMEENNPECPADTHAIRELRKTGATLVIITTLARRRRPGTGSPNAVA